MYQTSAISDLLMALAHTYFAASAWGPCCNRTMLSTAENVGFGIDLETGMRVLLRHRVASAPTVFLGSAVPELRSSWCNPHSHAWNLSQQNLSRKFEAKFSPGGVAFLVFLTGKGDVPRVSRFLAVSLGTSHSAKLTSYGRSDCGVLAVYRAKLIL